MTGLLVAFAVWGRPIVAVNSLAVWPLYLLFIFATSLRFDVRITLFAGALSLAQSLAVVLWVSGVWDLTSPDSQYGLLSWPIQIARLIMIIAATGLTIGIVRRSRRFIFVAGTDNLTGLWNRAYFDLRLSSELARARRRGNVLSVAFVDVDRFSRSTTDGATTRATRSYRPWPESSSRKAAGRISSSVGAGMSSS